MNLRPNYRDLPECSLGFVRLQPPTNSEVRFTLTQ